MPLAFLFVATLGSSGLATRWLADLGFDPYQHGFSLYSLSGVVVVYMAAGGSGIVTIATFLGSLTRVSVLLPGM